jgi:hypothetical protein
LHITSQTITSRFSRMVSPHCLKNSQRCQHDGQKRNSVCHRLCGCLCLYRRFTGLEGLTMQTLLGFWCIWRPSTYICRQVLVYYSDNGFGELIPHSLPIHSVETANL